MGRVIKVVCVSVKSKARVKDRYCQRAIVKLYCAIMVYLQRAFKIIISVSISVYIQIFFRSIPDQNIDMILEEGG